MKGRINGALRLGGAIFALSLTLVMTVFGQQPALGEYRFLATSDANRLEKDLNEAAREGFRLRFLSDTFADSQMGVLLWRSSPVPNNPTHPQFEYKVLGARKVSTMRKELEEAVTQGYELRGLTANASIFAFTVSETVAVLERPAGQTKPKYEYQFLTANREETLQQGLDKAVSEGFYPVALSVNRDNNAATVLLGVPVLRFDLILQRSLEQPAAEMAKREYRFISTMKPGTLEKELNQLGQQGWRIHQAGLVLVALLERDSNRKPEQAYEYRVLATRRTKTLQQELLEAGRQGWTFRGASGLIAIMEREHSGQNAPHDYTLLAAMRVKTTRKELDDTIRAGYDVIELASIGEYLIILDRTVATK
jgi:hypothetical protein